MNGIGAKLARLFSSAMVRKAAGSYSVQICGAIVGFGTQVGLANYLGPTHYGGFVLAISWITVLQVLCVLGFDRTSLRFASVYRGTQEWARLRGLIIDGHVWAVCAATLAGCVLGAAGWILAGPENRVMGWTFVISGLVLPPMSVGLLRASLLQAFRHVVVSQVPEQLIRPCALFLGVYILHRMRSGDVSSASAMAVNFGAVLVALLVGSLLLRRAIPGELAGVEAKRETGTWFKVALPLMLIAGLHIANKKLDVLFVGSYLGLEEAGIYGAASRLTDLLTFGLVAVNAIVSPSIAEAFAKAETIRLRRTLRMGAWGAFAFVVPAAVFLYFFGHHVLRLFGPEFVAAYPALIILLAGQVANAATGSVAAVMAMTGHQNQAVGITLGVFTLNVALNALLVPMYGINGAATATATAMTLMNLAMLVYVLKALNLNTTIIGRLYLSGDADA